MTENNIKKAGRPKLYNEDTVRKTFVIPKSKLHEVIILVNHHLSKYKVKNYGAKKNTINKRTRTNYNR